VLYKHVIGWRIDRGSLIGAANGAAQLSLLVQSPLHCHCCERNFDYLGPKLILHSDLRRRAASRRALPCPSSLWLKCTKFDFGWDSAPETPLGKLTALPGPPSWIYEVLLLREGRKGDGRGRRKDGRGMVGRERIKEGEREGRERKGMLFPIT